MRSYSSSSRLYRTKKIQLYRRIALFFTLSFVLVVGVFVVGLPLLIRVSLFLDSLRGAYEPVSIPDASLVLPPRLSASYEATNSATISLDGYGNSGDTVEVFVNDKKIAKLVVASDGSFHISDIELSEGDNKITAIATSMSGKKSEESTPLNVLYKKTPPNLELESPSEGASFSGENKEITISGKTDEDSKVYINERMVIVDSSGKFSFSYSLSEGANTIKIAAVDRAGNRKEIERKVEYKP